MRYPRTEDQEKGHVKAGEGECRNEGGDQLGEGGRIGRVNCRRADLDAIVRYSVPLRPAIPISHTLCRGASTLAVCVTEPILRILAST